MSDQHQNDWENDPVWTLLDQAEKPQARPSFVQDVLREVRLSEEASSPWWQALLGSKALVGGALAAAAAVALMISLQPNSGTEGVAGGGETPPEVEPAVPLSTLVEEELLLAASEDPSAFSDEELITMLY